MHPFKAYMSMYSDLAEEDWENIKPCLTHKIFQENRILLKPTAICNHLYFLEMGTIRYFEVNNNEIKTTQIINPPFLFTSAHSFTQQTPSMEGIQAVEESYLWILTRKDAYELLKIPSWKNFISSL